MNLNRRTFLATAIATALPIKVPASEPMPISLGRKPNKISVVLDQNPNAVHVGADHIADSIGVAYKYAMDKLAYGGTLELQISNTPWFVDNSNVTLQKDHELLVKVTNGSHLDFQGLTVNREGVIES